MAQNDEKADVRISRGKLYKGFSSFTVNAIEAPDILQPGSSFDTAIQTAGRIASVGANSVCFDLGGFSDDGTTLSPDVQQTIRRAIGQITWRRLGVICRIRADLDSQDKAYRNAMVTTAANAFKDETRMIYWISGPDTKRLVAKFKKIAPRLVVAAEKGGDLNVVTEIEDAEKDPLALLVGPMRAPDLLPRINVVVPGSDEMYEAYDKAMANPAESVAWTPDNSVLSAEERADGWISLFDGKSLDGWWFWGPNKKGFAVEDGTIVWKMAGGVALYSHDRYDNFILRLEWKIEEGGNSGIFLRAPRVGRQSKIGMEFQLQGDLGQPVEQHTTGAIYDVVAPRINASKPAGEWNTVEITLNGSMMKAVLNGEVVQDIDLDTNDELRVRIRRGFIGLQDHGCPVAFRNIRIKRL